ncbi:MAG: GC-type dockerin domain-anchored protein [Phycisphaerales bacterium JB039]
MRGSRHRRAACLCAALAGVAPAAADDYLWAAASGLLPDAADCRMTLVDSSEPEDPSLGAGLLTISNDDDPELMYYIMQGRALEVPARSEVTVRMRYVSGVSATELRTSAVIGITTEPNVGMALFVGEGEIFVVDGSAQRAGSAAAATSDAVHEYTIVIDGTAPGDSYTIFQDGAALITARLATSPGTFGSVTRVFFGDGTLLARGVSEWESVSHNLAREFYPDCDGNGVLDFFDFLCFQNAFATGDPYADCDATGTLDFFDFLCFQNEFATGCP